MANVNIVSIFSIIFVFTLLFTGLTYVLDDVSEKNTILSTESQSILVNYQTDVTNNVALADLQTPGVNTNVSSGGEAEDFSREFRESKAEIIQDKSRLEKVFSMPQIIVNSIGIDTDEQVSFYLVMIGILLTFFVGVAIFIAWKGGQVQN